jgi:hypothetical protein
LDLKQQSLDYSSFFHDSAPDAMSPNSSQNMAGAPKLQPSFTANDIATKNGGPMGPNANAHAQQHLHNHNVSIGRIPLGAMQKHHGRELSNDSHNGISQSPYPSIGSNLHANAPSFGPGITSQAPPQSVPTTAYSALSPTSSMGSYPYYNPSGYNNAGPNGAGFNMAMVTHQVNNMSLNAYPSQPYTGYAPVYQPQGRDSQQRVMRERRVQDGDGKIP